MEDDNDLDDRTERSLKRGRDGANEDDDEVVVGWTVE